MFKYNKINGESNKNIDDVKDLIFKRFKNTSLDEMDKNMLSEIKEFLYNLLEKELGFEIKPVDDISKVLR